MIRGNDGNEFRMVPIAIYFIRTSHSERDRERRRVVAAASVN